MRKIIFITISILLFVGIFWFSSKDATTSSAQSDDVIVSLKLMTEEEMIKEPIKASNYRFAIRKSAHFSIYALLGIFIYLSVKEFVGAGFTAYILGIFITAICAGVDEFHQSFVPGRSMEFRDVLIDSIGASTGIIALLLIGFIFAKKERHSNVYYFGRN